MLHFDNYEFKLNYICKRDSVSHSNSKYVYLSSVPATTLNTSTAPEGVGPKKVITLVGEKGAVLVLKMVSIQALFGVAEAERFAPSLE